jgi:hypothetical protein
MNRAIPFVLVLLGRGGSLSAGSSNLLEAIREPQFWGARNLPGSWQTVSARPVILKAKQPAPVLGFAPKRVFVYGEGEGVSQLVVVFAERGYNMDAWKQPAEPEKVKYRALFDRLVLDLPKALFRLCGAEPVTNILSAAADEFRFKVVDYAAHGLVYRLHCQTNNRTAITLTILPAGRAGTNLWRALPVEERRRQLLANVHRQANGDVLLQNVPAVDQDGRPYCGPAVWTEIGRYYGLDVHQEMMITGGRESGRGVNNAARLKQHFQKEWDFDKVVASIDAGNPVWFGAPGHVALVTGYNRAKREIFRTDSWGEGARNKRVPIERFVKESGPYMFFEPR